GRAGRGVWGRGCGGAARVIQPAVITAAEAVTRLATPPAPACVSASSPATRLAVVSARAPASATAAVRRGDRSATRESTYATTIEGAFPPPIAVTPAHAARTPPTPGSGPILRTPGRTTPPGGPRRGPAGPPPGRGGRAAGPPARRGRPGPGAAPAWSGGAAPRGAWGGRRGPPPRAPPRPGWGSPPWPPAIVRSRHDG